jgi:hypothetical protein
MISEENIKFLDPAISQKRLIYAFKLTEIISVKIFLFKSRINKKVNKILIVQYLKKILKKEVIFMTYILTDENEKLYS